MFFVASKVFWFIFQPSSLIALTLVTGLLLSFSKGQQRKGRSLGLLGVALLLLGGFSPLANGLILPLENRVARADLKTVDSITGIIVLGGAENGRISIARGGLALNEAGERIIEALALARRYKSARIVFTGGSGRVLREEKSGAFAIAAFLQTAGINATRIILEDQSRNTYENAVLTKIELNPKPGERWLLVTSAFHMPRSLGCFRKLGFDVVAWPVDYRTKDTSDLLRPFDSIAKGLKRLDLATKEWIGLIVYRLSGRTNMLFPK